MKKWKYLLMQDAVYRYTPYGDVLRLTYDGQFTPIHMQFRSFLDYRNSFEFVGEFDTMLELVNFMEPRAEHPQVRLLLTNLVQTI